VTERALTERELNRALLARQLLLERKRLSVATALERIGGLQAQHGPSPHIALWSRVAGFRPEQLDKALQEHKAVKATLMRVTLHILSTRDYFAFEPVLRTARRAWWADIGPRVGVAFDFDEVGRRTLELVGTGHRAPEELKQLVLGLAEGPAPSSGFHWRLAVGSASLVHTPPSGFWGHHGPGRFASDAGWLGRAVTPDDGDLARLVRRHLGAFGPATRGDVSSWSGLPVTTLAPGFEALKLKEYRDERGRRLYDVPRGPLPPADTRPPVRFLPKWDSTLLAFEAPERTRILPERYRKTVIRKNGDVLPTFLIDGFVAGSWSVKRTTKVAALLLDAFEPVPRSWKRELVEEGERLLRLLEPDAPAYDVRL
jgi:hypothetical protein